MDWQPVLDGAERFVSWSAKHANELRVTFGLGGGVGIVKYLRHMPAPYQDQIWWGSCFDTLQDLVSNTSRIGERRTREGLVIPPVPSPKEVPPPVAAPSDAKESQ